MVSSILINPTIDTHHGEAPQNMLNHSRAEYECSAGWLNPLFLQLQNVDFAFFLKSLNKTKADEYDSWALYILPGYLILCSEYFT